MENSFVSAQNDSQAARRFKCAACFKQFKKKTFLVEHMERAGHSLHDPRCGSCNKYCRCLDALREHLLGPLAKRDCAKQFAERGCSLCLSFFGSHDALASHYTSCHLAPSPSQTLVRHFESSLDLNKDISNKRGHSDNGQDNFTFENWALTSGNPQGAVALDCVMVGGGQDGSLDLCARVCVVDECDNVLLLTYVQPQLPITDYRFNITGVQPEDLVDAMPLKIVAEAVETILYNGPKYWTNRKYAKLLVGHSLYFDLKCLGIDYPSHLCRDTAHYPPLLKTSNACNKLQYLTKTYLGYQIQDGAAHHPYEDAAAAMRLYRRMKMAVHQCTSEKRELFASRRKKDLENLSPEALLEISNPRFQCWCLDS
eukprot:c19026_g1_i1 orf=97-1203(+)